MSWFDDEQRFQIYVSRGYHNVCAALILDELSMLLIHPEQRASIPTDDFEAAERAIMDTLRWITGDPTGEKISRWLELLRADPRCPVAIAEIWEHAAQAVMNYQQGHHPVR